MGTTRQWRKGEHLPLSTADSKNEWSFIFTPVYAFIPCRIKTSFYPLRSNTQNRNKLYEACPESKDTKVLNVYNIFNLQKRHCECIACTVAGIVQTFINSWNQLLYPRVIEVCRLSFEFFLSGGMRMVPLQ